MSKLNGDELFSYLISPSYLEVAKDYIRVNDNYYRTIEAVGYPRKIDDGWLRSFLSKNENYDISLHIEPSSIDRTIVFLYDEINKQTADLIMSTGKGNPNPALEIKLADTKRLHELLYKGEEKLFRISLYINNRENSLDKLTLLTEKCRANLNSILIIPKSANFRMAQALRSCLPLGQDYLRIQQEFPTNSLAATFPFISPAKPDKVGVFLGNEKETLNRIHIDFDNYENKHFFILGTSGSGKSYTAKSLMVQILFNTDSELFVIDPNAEYSGTITALGGQNVQISQDSKDNINLFDLADQNFPSKMLELIAAFDLIVGGLTESQKGTLNKLLPRAYARNGISTVDVKSWKNTPPTFTDVFQECNEMLKEKSSSSRDYPTIEVLLNRLSMYTKEGFFGFLDNQTNVGLKAKIVNFDLSKIPTALKPLAMFIVLGFISRRMKLSKSSKFIFIDEGWGLLRNKYAEDYILEYIKTSRKYGVGLGFITQEIEDFDKADAGTSILNLSATKILMKESTSNIEAISASLKLNDQEKDYLVKSNKGEGLLIVPEGHFKFQVRVPEMMHNLFTTDPKEATTVKVEKVIEPTPVIPEKKFNLNEGFFYLKDITDDQAKLCRDNKYIELDTNPFGMGSGPRVLIRPPSNQSPEHYYFCLVLQKEIEHYGKSALIYDTVLPDVIAFDGEKNVAFEVETGSERHEDILKEKFERVKRKFPEYYILVTNREIKARYEEYGKVILRTQIKETIERVCNNSPQNF